MTASSESAASGAVETTPAKQNASTATKRHEEYQYLDLVREILDEGEHRPDR